MFKIKNKKGFTLIELIVIMAIIGILVLLAMPKFMGNTKEAKFTKFIANTKNLETASERYYIDKNDWPKLSDIHYTAEEIKAFSQKIYDSTGKTIILDPDGSYYDIDYNKLQKYIHTPDDKLNYIIQNPVGNVYVLETLTSEATNRLQVGGVSLNKSNLLLAVGSNETLIATIIPNTAIAKSVTWTSNNTSVATVDSDGKVTAISAGDTVITATTKEGGYVANCNISVGTKVTGITLDKTTNTVFVGTTSTLVSTIQPLTASNKSVVWTSSNTAVTTVNSSGVITGVAVGNSTITAKTQDGNFVAICNTTVSSPPIPQMFNYSGSYQTYTVTTTGRYKLEVWGAKGGDMPEGYSNGANGGYSYGETMLTQGQSLYVYIGQKPVGILTLGATNAGGWNGGGAGYNYDQWNRRSGGGGATDIRTVVGNWNDPTGLNSRVIVAGGGGGTSTNTFSTGGWTADVNTYGLGGGGEVPALGATYYQINATATRGGINGYWAQANGSLGKGGQYIGKAIAGGGGGYYGGAGLNTAGGGSSYVGSLQNAEMETGTSVGTGKAKITYLGQ